MSDGKRKSEEGENEPVKKMKKLNEELMNEPLLNTPVKAKEAMEHAMTDKGDGELGDDVHLTNEKNPAFQKLFGEGDDDKEGEGEGQGKGKEGGGFWSFLGIGGRKRRRRKKSRKKRKKSKKRKSRRRRKRGGVPDSPEELKEKMKKMFRNSNEINMPCDTPFGACNTARNKAREVDSDLGQAWVDYQVAFINKNKGKMGRSLGVNRVKERLRNYYAYFNDLDAETKEAMKRGIIYQPDGIESIMAGGRRRKSRRKKRRKSKKRKSRRRSRRRRR
jgi:hypothetical protein